MEHNNAKRRSTAIILALLAIILSVTLITASTFALFSDSVKIRNHLQAGNLKISLTRTAYSREILDEDGYLELRKNADDYAGDKIENVSNVFELADGELIVPTSKLSASFNVKNESTVAFTYSIQLIVIDEEGKELTAEDYENLNLIKQLKLTLTGEGENNSVSGKLSDDENGDFIVEGKSIVTVGNSENFTVELEFLNLDDSVNNTAMNEKVHFDLVIRAVQSTTRPAVTPTNP